MTLIKKNSETSNFGIEPLNRSIEELFEKGALIIDKDAGPTSHQEVDYVKQILGVSKAGHSGTLDPNVTGVLLVGLGRATRLMEYMLHSDKEYICLCYFHKPISDFDLKKTFKEFTGTIKQTPPLVSAVKRVSRPRKIYELNLLDSQQDNQYVLFRVRCQHGTYIRKLCTDMGMHLGINAQMIELRRTKAGPLNENDGTISLDYLRNLFELYKEEPRDEYEKKLKEFIRPMEDLVTEFKRVVVKDSALPSLSHGHDLAIPGIISYEDSIEKDETIILLTQKNELVAIGKSLMSSSDIEDNSKGFCVKTEKVFIDSL